MIKLALILLLIAPVDSSPVKFSLSQQLKQSSGVVWGTVHSKVYTRSSEQEVLTEISLVLDKAAGIPVERITNRNNFIIYLGGGVWQGLRYRIPDGAQVEVGDEVIAVLTQKGPHFRLLGEANGLFKVKRNHNDEILLENSYLWGKKEMTITKAEEFVQESFPEGFGPIYNDQYVYQPKEDSKGGRSPASIEESEQEESPTSLVWLAIILGLMGAISFKIHRSK